MTLLNPMALAWAAIALPIVALYILRIRRRRQLVPTLMFWDQIFQDTRPRSLWRQLRHWLSLLLQLAFAVLLILALAEPIRSSAARKPMHYIVVLDESASMQATDGEPTRFHQAQSIAHRVIRSMRDFDQATIIGAAIRPMIACGRTYHQPTLHRSIDAMNSIDAPADLVSALALARSVDVGDQEKSIVVISDAAGARDLSPMTDASVSVYTCGHNTGNLAITGFAVRPRADNPVELQGMLKLANFSDKETDAQVRIEQDGDLFDMLVVHLAAGEEKLSSFQMINKGGGILSTKIATQDALPIDDQVVTILPAVRESKVALVTEGNLFLESVIVSHPWMKLTRLSPDQAASAINTADIIVYDRFVPDTVPAKPAMFVFPQKDSQLWTVGSEIKQPLVSDLDKDSDLLKHVSLQNVTFHSARAITPRVPGQEIVASFEHPLLLRWAQASPPVILLAVDINQSDLIWRTAFPILMQNALNDLAGENTEQRSTYRTGETVDIKLVGDAIQATDAQSQPIPTMTGLHQVTVGPVSTTGMVTVRSGDTTRLLAFNLANAKESDLRSPQPTTRPVNGTIAVSGFSWPWWVLLLIAAIALSTVEWSLHQRRVVD